MGLQKSPAFSKSMSQTIFEGLCAVSYKQSITLAQPLHLILSYFGAYGGCMTLSIILYFGKSDAIVHQDHARFAVSKVSPYNPSIPLVSMLSFCPFDLPVGDWENITKPKVQTQNPKP